MAAESLINNSLNKTPKFLDNTTNLENIQKKITKNQKRTIHHKNEQTARDLTKQEAEKPPKKRKKKRTPIEELERLKNPEDIDPSLILPNKRVAKPRNTNYKQ